MHNNKIAIFGSLVLSFLIMMTSVTMSLHSDYTLPTLYGVSISADDTISLPTRVISYDKLSKSQRKQVECLAKNIYYEAAHESHLGWLAVASVTMNRVLSGNYADSVCGVVNQNNGKTYQFSWVGMKTKLSKINEDVYDDVLKVATAVYLGYDQQRDDVTKGATYYHADYVNPGWKLERVKKIGRHIFYRNQRDYESIGE